MDIRAYLTTAQDAITQALATLPIVPTGPPQTYPWLRSDTAIVPVRSLQAPSRCGYVTDPDYPGVQLWRVTDDGDWGTLSAPNQCQVSADDKLFLALKQTGGFRVYEAGTFGIIREGVYSVEPTFSRVRPDVLYYAQHGTFLIKEANARTGVEKVLFDVQQDVGPLSQANEQYMGACYSSGGNKELIVTAYGRTQELHPYVTILRVLDPRDRVTIDVTNSRLKLGGNTWIPLLNHDGTPANLHYGVHSVSIDHSGEWARIDVSGNAQHVFYSISEECIYQWPTNAYQYSWYGHYAWGHNQIVRAICGPGDTGEYQWLFSDFTTPPAPPTFRKLIAQTPTNDQQYDDHPNWNHAQPDRLVPILIGTERPTYQTHAWQRYDDELGLVTTEPNAATEVYRIGHHRCTADGDFYATPRPQAFHSGRACLFGSHWQRSLAHGKNDLFLAQF